MFEVKVIKNELGAVHIVELLNVDESSLGRINLDLGGSLQELKINDKLIILDLTKYNYNQTFASAILFPFANRVKNGSYTFKERKYSLNKNQNQNALHGLVYDKKFEYVESDVSKVHASVTIKYVEVNENKGFPYKYSIYLTYTLTLRGLILNVQVKNNDSQPFPFNIGWHPYFFTSDLKDSYLEMSSTKKIVFDEQMIPIKVQDVDIKEAINLGDNYFDDCYKLNRKDVMLKTPQYSISLSSNSEKNYLQIYTPSLKSVVAIEPITGPANSFNHKQGLQVLEPSEVYVVSWKIELESDD